MALSDYEKIREKNIQDNKRILQELGLLNPFKPLPFVRQQKRPLKRKNDETENRPKKVARLSFTPASPQQDWENTPGSRRRSSRLRGKTADDSIQLEESEDEENVQPKRASVPANRPNVYGAIPGVEVGTFWETRLEANAAGIHRPTVAGIHGGPEGAYSLALSGGYEDDIDLGDCFTYTGEGGRDLKGTKANPKNLRTAPQSKDQTLTRGNLALSRSVESGLPVRVIRGYKLQSPFAPEEGYRYDGLYKVEKFWNTIGMAGYGIYKFALRRLDDQAPPPWELQGEESSEDPANKKGDAAPEKEQDQDNGTTSHEDLTNPSQKKEESPYPCGDEQDLQAESKLEVNLQDIKTEDRLSLDDDKKQDSSKQDLPEERQSTEKEHIEVRERSGSDSKVEITTEAGNSFENEEVKEKALPDDEKILNEKEGKTEDTSKTAAMTKMASTSEASAKQENDTRTKA